MKYLIILMSIFLTVSCNKKSNSDSVEKKDIKKKLETKKVKTTKNSHALHDKVRKTNAFKEIKAPEFTLENTTGDKVKLSDYKGKVILLDFWGTWCPPCRRMIPVLSSFVNKCSKEGVVLLGIHSAGNSPGPAKIDEFAGKMGVNYPMLLGTRENQNAYGVKSFPTLLIIGRDGMIKHKFVGVHPLSEIRKYVRKEMDKK